MEGRINRGKKKVEEKGLQFVIGWELIIELFEMAKKQKCPTCSKGWCSNHLFQLTPFGKDLYHRKALKLRLCPRLNKNVNEFHKTFPVLNRDRKFYTPTFILQQEQVSLYNTKNFYVENDARIRQNHDEKADIQVSGISELLVPKHGRKKNYCSVCKDEFEDYLEHIYSEPHKKAIRSNKYSVLINDFQHKYQALRQLRPPQPELAPDLIEQKLSVGRAQETHENSELKPEQL